jgi:hypothetical protein
VGGAPMGGEGMAVGGVREEEGKNWGKVLVKKMFFENFGEIVCLY